MKHEHLVSFAWAVTAVFFATLAWSACSSAPGSVAAWSAAGLAGADALVTSAVDSKQMDAGFGTALLNIIHNIAGSVAGFGELKAQVAAQAAQHAADLAAVKAQVPTGSERLLEIAAGGASGFSMTRLHRGSPTPRPKA